VRLSSSNSVVILAVFVNVGLSARCRCIATVGMCGSGARGCMGLGLVFPGCAQLEAWLPVMPPAQCGLGSEIMSACFGLVC
jgi:hypothetical protein